MRVYLEHVQCDGESEEINYATLKAKIVGVSQERGPHCGELNAQRYVDITLDKCGWDLLPKRQQPKNRINRDKFAVTLEQLTALTNALGARKPQELKRMEVTALYNIRYGDRYDLIGFIRPKDRVEIEK